MSKTIVLDVGDFDEPRALHQYLAAALGFPEWYGQNWDAFWDCVLDPSLSRMPEGLVIKGFPALSRVLPREAKIFKKCLEDLGDCRAGITLEWPQE